MTADEEFLASMPPGMDTTSEYLSRNDECKRLRATIIETCAQIADDEDAQTAGGNGTARRIAAAIRALP